MLVLPHVRVAAVVRNDRNDVLLVRHFNLGKPFWTVPGGAPHGVESVKEAVVREVAEETGIVISIDGLLAVGSLRRDRWDAPKIELFFAGRIVSRGAPFRAGESIVEYGFFSAEQLPSPLLPPELPEVLGVAHISPFLDLSFLQAAGE